MLAAAAPATRARSYDVLTDKAHYQVPENQLQLLRPYQARVQKSLEKLDVPAWFKQAQTSGGPGGSYSRAETPETPRWRRGGAADGGDETPRWRRGQSCRPGWRRDSGTQSSLGGGYISSRPNTPGPDSSDRGSLATTPRESSICSTPCPPGSSYSRWSTSRLAHPPAGSLPAPSPAHSNYSIKSWQSAAPASGRQPYLGWRSQERLSGGATYLSSPAQRLASSTLAPRPPPHRPPPPPN